MSLSNDPVADGNLRHRNSLAWRLILPVPLTLALVVAVIWALLPRIMESTATHDALLSNQQVANQFKIIRGYPSSVSVLLAMERGEVDGLCGIGTRGISGLKHQRNGGGETDQHSDRTSQRGCTRDG